MNQETRNLNCEIRAGQSDSSKEMTLVGRAISYNSLSLPLGPTGSFRERVLPGAFTKSLASGRNVVADFNHLTNTLPLGTTQAKTLVLTDTPNGINFRCTLDPNQEAHRALYSSVRRGDTKSCSWAFDVDGEDGEQWDIDKDEEGRSFNRRSIVRANLRGISIVNHPAYPGDATSVSARSAQAVLIPTRRSRHAAAFRNVPAGISLEEYRDEHALIALRAHARRISRVIEADESVVRRERCAELTKRIHEVAEGRGSSND